jgi:GT2 family glycosyltransferase
MTMPPSLSVSIIISTCNRSSALRHTLNTLENVRLAADRQVQLILVDNGSIDDTASVVRKANFAHLQLEYLYEPKKGHNNALNAALARARGEIVLFTDDDVAISEDWVEQMVTVFVESQADAVVGKIVLNQDLLRPWLSGHQKWMLAAPDDQIDEPPELIGANMGFRRAVLDRVPAFDPELGPGALGFGGDTLFCMQLVEAGFKIKYAPHAVIVHHPERSRLQRHAWLDSACKLGRKTAYIRYHWAHDDIRAPFAKWLWYTFQLQLRRILQPPPPLASEGCPAWEMSYVTYKAACGQFCVERRRPRNYLRRGLQKRSGAELRVVKGRINVGQWPRGSLTPRN